MYLQNDNQVAKPTQLKISNRKSVMNVLKNGEAYSIAEIASLTGISRQTVAKAVDHFVETKLVVEVGKGESTDSGGKKPNLFRLTSEFKFLIIQSRGLDFSISLFDLNAENAIDQTRPEPVPEKGNFEDFLEILRKSADELLSRNHISRRSLYGITIIVPGVVENNRLLRFNPFNKNWGQNVPIADLIAKIYPAAKLIAVENINRVAGVGTIRNAGGAYDRSRAVTIYTSHGIAGCLFNHGELISNSSPIIGEFGHMSIEPDSPIVCICGQPGCFESLVRPDSIQGRLQNEPELPEFLQFVRKPLAEIQFCDIVSGADNGFVCCIRELERLGSYFARVFLNIAVVYDPDVFIIEGFFACFNRAFEDIVKRRTANFLIVPPNRNYRLESDPTPLAELELTGAVYKIKELFFGDESIYQTQRFSSEPGPNQETAPY